MTIKALVVDNNPVLLRAVSAILSQEGCDVVSAGTGLAAIEALEDFLPDILFTDLIMPLVSGEQLCRVLRNTERYQNIFIVVLSAIVLEDRERIQREVPCDLCIAKGDLKEIRKHLQEALQAYKSHATNVHGKPNKAAKIPSGLKPSGVTSELLLEKQHAMAILANLEEGIVELSNQGKVVTVNRAATEILGLPEEAMIGCWFGDLIDWCDFKVPVEMWTNAQLIKEGMRSLVVGEEAPLHVNDKIVTASFTPVRERNGLFGLCIFHDITRQYVAEKYKRDIDDAIKLVKKMDAMSCMAGGVAHDFNNLLTVICGNLDIVTMFGDRQLSGERNKLLEQARKAAIAAVDLTRQISGFSNFGIVSRYLVDFGELIQGAVEKYCEGRKHRITVQVQPDIGKVYVDEEQIYQAVAGVLQNAGEASTTLTVDIRVDKVVFDRPQLMSGQYVPAGLYGLVTFRDYGCGIGRDKLLSIFDPYYSTKERGALKGMGLGLAIVYSTLRNHGGHVVVTSEPGQGTTVSFFIPLSQPQATGEREDKALSIPRHVVVLEPDMATQELANVMLTHLGYSVSVAGNADDLYGEVTRSFQSESIANAALVLMEISHLDTNEAVEICNSIKALGPDIKIVATSGTVIGPIMENCHQYGFIGALSKPYSMDSLKHTVASVLARQ